MPSHSTKKVATSVIKACGMPFQWAIADAGMCPWVCCAWEQTFKSGSGLVTDVRASQLTVAGADFEPYGTAELASLGGDALPRSAGYR